MKQKLKKGEQKLENKMFSLKWKRHVNNIIIWKEMEIEKVENVHRIVGKLNPCIKHELFNNNNNNNGQLTHKCRRTITYLLFEIFCSVLSFDMQQTENRTNGREIKNENSK